MPQVTLNLPDELSTFLTASGPPSKLLLSKRFDSWCQARGLASLPTTPQVVAVYISDLAVTHKPATIGRSPGEHRKRPQGAELR